MFKFRVTFRGRTAAGIGRTAPNRQLLNIILLGIGSSAHVKHRQCPACHPRDGGVITNDDTCIRQARHGTADQSEAAVALAYFRWCAEQSKDLTNPVLAGGGIATRRKTIQYHFIGRRIIENCGAPASPPSSDEAAWKTRSSLKFAYACERNMRQPWPQGHETEREQQPKDTASVTCFHGFTPTELAKAKCFK